MEGEGGGGGGAAASSKADRKIVEKNRRIQMKTLCFKLTSLIPRQYISKDALAQHDLLHNAVTYIKILKERIERLKQRKHMLATSKEGSSITDKEMEIEEAGLPVIEVRHQQDSTLEVLLITGLKKKMDEKKRFMLYEVIVVLEEEGAEVVNASFSVVGDKIFHTIHSQAISARIGFEASKVSERLKELIQ